MALPLFVSSQVRLMMKAHSFVRENVPRVLAWAKEKTSMETHPFVCAYCAHHVCSCYCAYLKLITGSLSSRP